MLCFQGSDTKEVDKSVQFVLMIRGGKGGKQQFKTFDAPSDSLLAVNLKLQEEKIREENEKVKRLVKYLYKNIKILVLIIFSSLSNRLTLNITERIEEEDYQESLLQNQRSPAPNKFSKQNKQQKYKHQKGAPDADLIFQ